MPNYRPPSDYEDGYGRPAAGQRTRPGVNIRVEGQPGTAVGRPANVPQPLQNTAPQYRPARPPQQISGQYRVAPPQLAAPNFNQDTRVRREARPAPARFSLPFNAINAKVLLVLGGAVLTCIIGFIIVSSVINWWNRWQDDINYGYPRTMQLSGFVGHNESSGAQTHFTAQNLDGQIMITEVPGGDPEKTRVIKGPRLTSKDANLAPVKIRLEDINADGHVDLIMQTDGIVQVYINENGSFREATASEQGKFKLSGGK